MYVKIINIKLINCNIKIGSYKRIYVVKKRTCLHETVFSNHIQNLYTSFFTLYFWM